MMKHKVTLLLSACIPYRSSPFHFPSASSTPYQKCRGNTRLNSDVTRDEIAPETIQVDAGPNENIEIWLDLRGTSISPKMALELWQTEVQEMQLDQTSCPQIIPFAKCLISYNEQRPFKLDMGEVVDVLMVDKDGHFINSPSHKQSSTIGEIVTLELSLSQSNPIPDLPDPLPLIDKYSNGEWILLDTNSWKKMDESEKLDALYPLVEIITSMEQPGNSGRIGWTCHSKSEVTKSAMWMRCRGRRGSSVPTKTLESGIIVPNSEASIVQDEENTKKFVIVIPYDVGLLKTAMTFIHCDSGGALM